MSPADRCPACGAAMCDDLHRGPYPGASAGEGRPTAVVVCGRCGLGVAEPMPDAEALAALYSEGGYWHAAGPHAFEPGLEPGHYALAQARWRSLRDHLPARGTDGLRLLDVGAGHGFLLLAASRDRSVRVAEAHAVEPDRALRESLPLTWAEHAGSGTVGVHADLDEVTGTFDAVCLSNVIEHVAEPGPLLARAAGLLADGGVLYVDVPCRDDRFKGDVFPHVLFFDEGPLTALLERVGLSVLDIGTFGRPPSRSPVAAANEGGVESRLVRLLYPLRRVLPESVSVAAFARHYGASRRGDDGTWVRAVARRGPDGTGPAC